MKRRRVNGGVVGGLTATSTSGSSTAGGSLATAASSSGVGASQSRRRRRRPAAATTASAAAAGLGVALRAVGGPVADRSSTPTAVHAARRQPPCRSAGTVGRGRRPTSSALAVVAGAGEQRAVQRRARQQLLVGALVGHPAVVDDDDAVGQAQGRAPVGDQQRRAALHERAQRGVDLLLGLRVDRGGGVVEDQHARVGDQRPGEGDALALAARQGEPALADDGVVAVGQGE